MKVLFVVPNYEPAWAFGGVVRCISTLCRSLAQIGVDVSVYTTNVDGRGGLLPVIPQEPTMVGGVTVTYFPSTFGRNSDWDSRCLSKQLSQTIKDFDLVYIAAAWQWIGISAGRIAKSWGIPYIIGSHGSFHPVGLNTSKLKKKLFWYLFLKKCIKSSAAIHFTTNYEREVSKRLLHNHPSFVIPNALPPDHFALTQTATWRWPDKSQITSENIILLSVVRPDPVKRLDILLQAFAIVCQNIPTARLVIVGDCENEYSRQMKTLSNILGIEEQTVWAGYQTGEALNTYYRQSHLFILTSAHENFSLVTIEAMAAGLATVVTQFVGVAEAVERYQTGLVVELNANEVAKAILSLLQDPKSLHEMGENAKTAVQQLYRSEKVAHLMLKAFQDVLTHSHSSECAWQ